MAPDPKQLLEQITGWRAQGGVVSAYVGIDHGDRGEGWRIELKNQLARIDHAAAEQILARYGESSANSTGRSQAGFLELGGAGREIWHEFQMPISRTEVVEADRPYLEPLIRMLDEGWPLGVLVVGLENVRVLEWTLGEITELDGWELEITSLDWHERKAHRVDPSSGTGTSASGRDQHAQRLEHNRERFLKEAGALVVSRYAERPWRQLVVIGEGDRPRLLARGLGKLAELVHEVAHDLIRETASAIGARLEHEVEALNRSREEALVARVEEAIGATLAALGPDEVLATLAEGRVRHLIFDAEREWKPVDGVAASEVMIERALATGAEITPAEGSAAGLLARHEGAVALLRY